MDELSQSPRHPEPHRQLASEKTPLRPESLLSPVVEKPSLESLYPWLKDFLALDWGPLEAVAGTPDPTAPERTVLNLTFKNKANNYKNFLINISAAEQGYREIIAYLARDHYNTHRVFFEENVLPCEIVFGTFRKTTRDFSLDCRREAEPRAQIPAMPDLDTPQLIASLAAATSIDQKEIEDFVAAKLKLAAAADEITNRRETAELTVGPEATEAPASAEAVESTEGVEPPPGRLKWGRHNEPEESPAVFAWRAFAVEAKAGTLHRGLIAKEDKPLGIKLANWLRTHSMPEGVDIPSHPEWVTRQLAKIDGMPKATRSEEGKLYDAARHRQSKANQALTRM